MLKLVYAKNEIKFQLVFRWFSDCELLAGSDDCQLVRTFDQLCEPGFRLDHFLCVLPPPGGPALSNLQSGKSLHQGKTWRT